MAYFIHLDNEQQGKLTRLSGEAVIGRGQGSDLCVPDNRVSRRHATLEPTGDGYVIRDLGSANGTYVNRERLTAQEPRLLKDGDEVLVGSARLAFHEGTPEERGATSAASAAAAPAFSLVVTAGENDAAVVKSVLDASLSMIDLRAEERKSSQAMADAVKRLQAMVKISNSLGNLTDLGQVLERIMDSLFDVFPRADRACVLLLEPNGTELRPAVSRTRRPDADAQQFAVSRTIIETVIEQKQSVLSSDAQQDSRFGGQQSILDLSIRSMMCAPFICQGEILGVIHVDTTSQMQSFSGDDLAVLTGLAAQAAIAIKNTDLFAKVADETRTRAHLSRYLSPDVVQGVLDGRVPLQLGGRKAQGTVLFCDIIGFTAMAEAMTPMAVMDRLNQYFHITTAIVTRHSGTLHKFEGDMILAFWNVMFPDAAPEYHALLTGLEMQSAVWSLNLELGRHHQTPVRVGIGCNTGEFVAGNIGGEGRMEYTIIGDNVNLGQRIETLAGRWQVLVAEETYQAVRDACIAVALPPAEVKGKNAPIRVYSIRGLRTEQGLIALALPARITPADGGASVPGFIRAARGLADQMSLELVPQTPLPAGQIVQVELELPELETTLQLTATVEAPPAADASQPLTHLQSGADVVAFFQPGNALTSDRSWSDMRRG